MNVWSSLIIFAQLGEQDKFVNIGRIKIDIIPECDVNDIVYRTVAVSYNVIIDGMLLFYCRWQKWFVCELQSLY